MLTIASDQDIQDMARGAVFLGSGGGGDPYVGELYLRQQLAEGRNAKIVKATELADDAFVISIAGVGAPTVLVEHLVSTSTLIRLLEASEKFYGRKVDALISAEIGGANSMFPLALGARSGVPVIDGDGMGRAFPHLEMTTFSVYGARCCPSLLMDDSGNVIQVDTVTDRIAEDVVRSVCASLGSMIYGSFYPMSGRQVKEIAVHDTISHTLEIGRRIRRARESQTDPIRDLLDFLDSPGERRHARELFNGRIVDVRHETREGWHWGQALINSGRGDEPEFSGPDRRARRGISRTADGRDVELRAACLRDRIQRSADHAARREPRGIRTPHVRHRRGLPGRRGTRSVQPRTTRVSPLKRARSVVRLTVSGERT
jgi:DUF917 family protein